MFLRTHWKSVSRKIQVTGLKQRSFFNIHIWDQHPSLELKRVNGKELNFSFVGLQFDVFSSFQSVSKLSEQNKSNEKSNKYEVQKSEP